MCLINKPSDVKAFLKSKAQNKTGNIIVWKILIKNEDGYDSSIYNHKWKNGLNISNTKRRTTSTRNETIDRGFHVYLSKKEAVHEISGYSHRGYRLIKLTANIKDLIAVNFHNQWAKQAVFSKLTVQLPK